MIDITTMPIEIVNGYTLEDDQLFEIGDMYLTSDELDEFKEKLSSAIDDLM